MSLFVCSLKFIRVSSKTIDFAAIKPPTRSETCAQAPTQPPSPPPTHRNVTYRLPYNNVIISFAASSFDLAEYPVAPEQMKEGMAFQLQLFSKWGR